jgi:hypothetical protein
MEESGKFRILKSLKERMGHYYEAPKLGKSDLHARILLYSPLLMQSVTCSSHRGMGRDTHALWLLIPGPESQHLGD